MENVVQCRLSKYNKSNNTNNNRNKNQLQQFIVNLKRENKSKANSENVVQLMMLKGLSSEMCVHE